MFFAVLLAGSGIGAADADSTALFFPINIPDSKRDDEYQNYNRYERSQIHYDSLLSINVTKNNHYKNFADYITNNYALAPCRRA